MDSQGIIAVMAGMLLAACTSPGASARVDAPLLRVQAACKSFGFVEGTDIFAVCVMQQANLQREEDRRKQETLLRISKCYAEQTGYFKPCV